MRNLLLGILMCSIEIYMALMYSPDIYKKYGFAAVGVVIATLFLIDIVQELQIIYEERPKKRKPKKKKNETLRHVMLFIVLEAVAVTILAAITISGFSIPVQIIGATLIITGMFAIVI